MSLYRKYRPQDFSTLRGQDHVRGILQSALKQGKVSHAYLFTGPRGTGKTSTARILARAINCVDLQASGPCNSCESCTAALAERLTDFIEIDAASHGLVEDARTLVEQARFMPSQAKKKIYLIDEVHMLSKSAFNALLKIIEEPPEHVHFILATTEAHKVLDTIVSRCQRFDFHLAEDDMIVRTLQDVSNAEGVRPEPAALALLAQQARGSFRDALSLLEQVIALGDFTAAQARSTLGLSNQSAVTDFTNALFSRDQARAFCITHELHEQGGDLYQFCQDVLRQLRCRLHQPSPELPSSKILFALDTFFTALEQLKDPVIAELPLEMAVVKIMAVDVDQYQISQPQLAEVLPTDPVPPALPQAVLFDPTKFISAIKPASLRSMLKFSQLEFQGNELKILSKSPFELEKLKQRDHQAELVQALRSVFGDQAYLTFGIHEQPAPAKTSGLQAKDLQSIF
jgi:DNA polymerase III subunit gamma/tau